MRWRLRSGWSLGVLLIVIVATIIDAMSGPDGTDYATGIHASYLLGLGLAIAGLIATVLLLPRRQTLE